MQFKYISECIFGKELLSTHEIHFLDTANVSWMGGLILSFGLDHLVMAGNLSSDTIDLCLTSKLSLKEINIIDSDINKRLFQEQKLLDVSQSHFWRDFIGLEADFSWLIKNSEGYNDGIQISFDDRGIILQVLMFSDLYLYSFR